MPHPCHCPCNNYFEATEEIAEAAHPPLLKHANKMYDPKLIDMVTRSIVARHDANAKMKLGWSEDDTMWTLHGIEFAMALFG